jgi:hypothetical protein
VNPAGTNPPPVTGTYFWKFTAAGKTHQGIVDEDGVLEPVQITPTVSITTISFFGSNATGDTSIVLAIADINNSINNETYVSNTTSGNAALIDIDYGGDTFSADPQVTNAAVTVTVTTHNTTTKVLAGTFSGTLKNANGQLLTISNGSFNIHYQ